MTWLPLGIVVAGMAVYGALVYRAHRNLRARERKVAAGIAEARAILEETLAAIDGFRNDVRVIES